MEKLTTSPHKKLASASVCSTTSEQQSSPTYSSQRTSDQFIFILSDQPMPAGLVRLLLLMAGIESNPGPDICSVCLVKMKKNTKSVWCNKCCLWVHLRKINNCSNLKSVKDYNKDYICPVCLIDPLPNPPSPTNNPQHFSPDPTTSPTIQTPNTDRQYQLKILQWNCNGIKNKLQELIDFVQNKKIKKTSSKYDKG